MGEQHGGNTKHYDDHDAGGEWATPPRIWRPLSEALGGFDLDPTSGAEPVPIAETRYTKEDNGLAKPWFGDVWANPEYGRDENPKWAKKIAGEARRDEVSTITALVPAATGAEWYQDNYGTADIETFVRHRIKFIGEKDDDPSFYNVIVTWGDVPPAYIDALQMLGQVRPIPNGETHQTSLDAAVEVLRA